MLGATSQTTSSAASILDLGGNSAGAGKPAEASASSFGQTLDEQVYQTRTQDVTPKKKQEPSTGTAPAAASEAEDEVNAPTAQGTEDGDTTAQAAAADGTELVETETPSDDMPSLLQWLNREQSITMQTAASANPVAESAATMAENGKNLPSAAQVVNARLAGAVPEGKPAMPEQASPSKPEASQSVAAVKGEQAELDLLLGQDKGPSSKTAEAGLQNGSSTAKSSLFDQLLQAMPRAQPSAPLAGQAGQATPILSPNGQGMAQSASMLTPQGPLLQVPVPVQQNGWDALMGERVVWMARQGVQQAQIQVNPRELGPIEVRVSLNNDQANVTFVAQNAQTREALDAALPRLREMFNEQGLNLSDASVSQQSKEQAQRQGEEDARHGRAGPEAVGDQAADAPPVTALHSDRGLLDYYA